MAYLDNTGLSTFLTKIRNLAVPSSLKGNTNGIASLDTNAKVPINQLNDSYRKILEYSNRNNFPVAGEADKLYIDKEKNNIYLWNGSQYTIINEEETHKVYTFHIDGSESDPSLKVTYIGNTAGMTPAYMDFTNHEFVWGSWENAFFLPRPCMVKPDGTVDFYLDEDDYDKKADGTPSHVGDLGIVESGFTATAEHLTDSYFVIGDVLYQATSDIDVDDPIEVGINATIIEGVNALDNAMMEWGRNGRIIWYKIVPDTNDNTSATVYVANEQLDDSYVCWPFVNNYGNIVSHFYTAIYDGKVVNNVIRSLSAQTSLTETGRRSFSQHCDLAKANNTNLDLWNIEVYCDITLINILLILMGKSTNTQAVFGTGINNWTEEWCSQIFSGYHNTKGLFYGENITSGSFTNSGCVKVFGMENYWGFLYRRLLGLGSVGRSIKYKMTNSNQDGSNLLNYPIPGNELSWENALSHGAIITGDGASLNTGYIKYMKFDNNQFCCIETGGSEQTYYCDDFWHDSAQSSSTQYWTHRSNAGSGKRGAYSFAVIDYPNASASSYWGYSATVSCKPLA